MKVIKTDNCNFVYRGPEPGIGDLPCERRTVDGHGRTAIFSVWELSDEDRKAIAEGANVELGIWHVEPIPPVSLNLTTRGTKAFPVEGVCTRGAAKARTGLLDATGREVPVHRWEFEPSGPGVSRGGGGNSLNAEEFKKMRVIGNVFDDAGLFYPARRGEKNGGGAS